MHHLSFLPGYRAFTETVVAKVLWSDPVSRARVIVTFSTFVNSTSKVCPPSCVGVSVRVGVRPLSMAHLARFLAVRSGEVPVSQHGCLQLRPPARM